MSVIRYGRTLARALSRSNYLHLDTIDLNPLKSGEREKKNGADPDAYILMMLEAGSKHYRGTPTNPYLRLQVYISSVLFMF